MNNEKLKALFQWHELIRDILLRSTFGKEQPQSLNYLLSNPCKTSWYLTRMRQQNDKSGQASLNDKLFSI